jgi:kynurenine formamidase
MFATRLHLVSASVAVMAAALFMAAARPDHAQIPVQTDLWRVYDDVLAHAKYVDLTHTITPGIPVWRGFGRSRFAPAVNPQTGKAYTYREDGFEATQYQLATDQLGTQLDPPAHWAPEYPAIDELPPTYAIRPLVVISIVSEVRRDPGYQMRVSDIQRWESSHGRIPEGSVVFVRSDWSKRWPDPRLADETRFPGVTLEALQFLHEQRHILMHGHEPLDTDDTTNLEGESWLMHHGYTQAEGVANLDMVPEAGALVAIGYPKLKGGTGGYARYIAICPSDWKYGATIGNGDAPLPRFARELHWDFKAGARVR